MKIPPRPRIVDKILSTPIGEKIQTHLPYWLYALALFHLPAGRITYPTGFDEIKVGENMENLLPALLIARFLDRRRFSFPWKPASRPLAPGLFLIFSGLILTFLHLPNWESLEDVFRLAGRVAVGAILAEWIYDHRREGRWSWAPPFLVGLAWLFFWTPWRSIAIPDLEGPFTHRNLQAAFYLLSLPLLVSLIRTEGKQGKAIVPLSLAFIAVGIAFIFLSRSRAGVLGLVAGLGILPVLSPLFLAGSRKRRALVLGIAFTVGAGAILLLLPRFLELGQEIGNPYHRSRTAIWGAAVHAWQEPVHWMFGIGMDDAYDRILLESPTGNLNYRYRRAHYPHGLYFQWIYWGGITALLGWFVLLLDMTRQELRSKKGFDTALVMACLLGFAILEVFESSLRDQRVCTLFWMNVFWLGAMWQGIPEPNVVELRPGGGRK
jgi:O-antigen ligase